MKFLPPALLLLIVVCSAPTGYSQTKTRKLGAPINHPSKNAFAPYMSLDGFTLLMASDDTEDENLGVFYATKEAGIWSEPVQIPRTITITTLTKGYTLSPDGKTIYLTSSTSRGLGGFDIMVTRRIGGAWAPPENFGKPINSAQHEGSPTFSPDGKTIYFMRCKTMDTQKADGCMIYTARRSGNQWSEPELLPAHINTGNSQFPRIMADNETLIFSSNRIPGSKGGYDLYLTRTTKAGWSRPVPLDFVNTSRDDQYVSVNGVGQYLTRDQPAKSVSEIVEYSFPPDLSPQAMQRLSGSVFSGGKPAQAYISVTPASAPDARVQISPDEEGQYFVYLKGGDRYEVAFEPGADELLYYSKLIDLSAPGFQPMEKLDVTLEPLRPNTTFFLDNLSFVANGDRLAEPYEEELRRLSRVIQASTELKFDFRVYLNRYREDSVQRDADLTEIRIDSTWIHITIEPDSLVATDSATVVPDSLTIIEYDTLVIRKTYHNDRTLRQARAVAEALLQKGVPPEQLAWEGRRAESSDPKLPAIRLEVAVLRKDQ